MCFSRRLSTRHSLSKCQRRSELLVLLNQNFRDIHILDRKWKNNCLFCEIKDK